MNETSLFEDWGWQPPSHWQAISTIDLHCGGEPLRVYTGGIPPLPGNTVLEKRRYFRDHLDYIRTGTLWEPRGHADMYGAVLSPATDADFDVFFLHNEGYSTMCGHAIIALTTLVFDTGLKIPRDGMAQLTFNVPAGRIASHASLLRGRVTEAVFRNVPSFVYLREVVVDVPGIGNLTVDVAYGGAFYVIVDAEAIGLTLTPDQASRLIEFGRLITVAVAARYPMIHPYEADLSFLYGTIFTGRPVTSGHHSRNACIFADGELDRSATGSGVSARAALHYARGDLGVGEEIVIESILGSTMKVRVIGTARFGDFDAVIPEVAGTASITGQSRFYFDPADPFQAGFFLR